MLAIAFASAGFGEGFQRKSPAAGKVIGRGLVMPLCTPNGTGSAVVLRAEQVSKAHGGRCGNRMWLLQSLLMGLNIAR